MQTFLPYESFIDSAKCLDKKRLWKQVVETRQLLDVLDGKKLGWKNHPAAKMWLGYRDLLFTYFQEMLIESLNRGIKVKAYSVVEYKQQEQFTDKPKFLGNPEFHASHRSNLLRKDFEYYSKFGWQESTTLEYIWAVA